MAARLRLGNYETAQGDPLGRAYTGYFPRMTEQEAWEAGRGVWRMSADKASRQKFALIVGEGLVRAAGQIAGFRVHGDRIELLGDVLPEGHPVRDAYLGRPDPVETGFAESRWLLRPARGAAVRPAPVPLRLRAGHRP